MIILKKTNKIILSILITLIFITNGWSRYYNALNGRWISKDKISGKAQNPQSLNRYIYCENNPLIYSDPNGYFKVLVHTQKWGHVGYHAEEISYNYGRYRRSWGLLGTKGEGILRRTVGEGNIKDILKKEGGAVYDFNTSSELDKKINAAFKKKWDSGKLVEGKLDDKIINEYYIKGPNCVTTTFDTIEEALNNIISEEMQKAPKMRNKGIIAEAKSTLKKIKKYKEDYDPEDVAPKLKKDSNIKDVTSEYKDKNNEK